MLQSKTVLIMEANGYGALDLSSAVEACDGRVAGPVATAAGALTMIDSHEIAAAVVDCELDDAFEVVIRLADSNVPQVIRTSSPLPPSLAFLDNRTGVLIKPVDAEMVIDVLIIEIAKAEMRQKQNRLGVPLKQV